MMLERSYKLWVISRSGTTLSCDEFQSLVQDLILSAHNSCPYLNCTVRLDSKQLNDNPPPCSFYFRLTVTKNTQDKSKNYISKSLLDFPFRTHSEIKDYFVERINC